MLIDARRLESICIETYSYTIIATNMRIALDRTGASSIPFDQVTR